MCWSFRVSIATAIWGYLVSAIAWKRQRSPREKWNAIFLASFCSVQTAEALIWWDIEFRHPGQPFTCTPWNQAVTSTVLLVALFGQLIMNLVGAHVGKARPHKIVSVLVVVLTLALVVRRVWATMVLPAWPCTTITPGRHLLWFDKKYPLVVTIAFAVILSLPLVYMRPKRAGFVALAVMWGACLYAATTDSNGSLWCLWGNLWSFFVLLDPHIYGTAAKHPQKSKKRANKKRAN